MGGGGGGGGGIAVKWSNFVTSISWVILCLVLSTDVQTVCMTMFRLLFITKGLVVKSRHLENTAITLTYNKAVNLWFPKLKYLHNYTYLQIT